MKRPRSVEAQLSRLRKLDDQVLAAWYRRYCRKPAPKGIAREFLLHSVGFRLQQELIAQLRFRISRTLGAAEAILMALTIGSWRTVLVGIWRGQCYVVTLLDDGVSYQGREYRSLAGVARRITGGRLSAAELFGIANHAGPGASNDQT